MSPDTTPEPLDQAIARGGGLDTLLRDLTDRAVQAVPGAAACSITVRRGERLLTLAGSSGLPSGLDLRQYEDGSGPCVSAAGTGDERYVPDTAEETRWPDYTRYALSVGVRCVLALPLAVPGETGAALNLYGFEPDGLAADRERARAFAARAADAVTVALRVEGERAAAPDVRTALLSRSVIDQAIGILMAQERVDAQRALERLRGMSQHHNTKLRDLAADLVSRAARPQRSPRPPLPPRAPSGRGQ
ncbi:ANTAR domain-containing protein [Streptomyces anandii]|uniref:ANTAR domain-containing protein n=1 Tax=Streptomyces anandii TaxID=285454 RepID=UPI0036BE87C6